ncbi:MAG: FAD-dependent oxidoreductase, partial [Planctomycetes bacterium]|nr:FAD-dependent oxidoreductase [Planctomycetota bacterium]
CVSLGSHSRLLALEEQDQQKRVLGRWNYEHPLFTPRSTEAVARWSELDGRRRTHFVGAYWRNGFHEDGVWSALRVCEKFGRSL